MSTSNGLRIFSAFPNIDDGVGTTSIANTLVIKSNTCKTCCKFRLSEETLLCVLDKWLPELNVLGSNSYCCKVIALSKVECNVKDLVGVTLFFPDKSTTLNIEEVYIVIIVEINTSNIFAIR